MAWGSRAPSKDELKEAGLDVDAFTAAIEKTKKIDELVTSFASLKESVDGFTALKDSLAGLENKLKELKPPTNNGGGGGNNSGGDGSDGRSKEEELDWVLEPEKATQATISKLMTPIITATADMKAQMFYDRFAATRPKGFTKYETEIKELWDKQPLAAKQNPEVIQNCYKVVIAGHIDEIQKGGESFFIESSSGSSSGGATGAGQQSGKKAEDILNKDQLELCAKWGVTPEDYLKELQAGGVTTYA
jgi:hypothetical protein